MKQNIDICDLAVIGDRRTCAYISKNGSVVWYCPGRFDGPSLFADLLDPGKGGVWELYIPQFVFEKRSYIRDSSVLQTHFSGAAGKLKVEDWMPMGADFTGICRMLSETPVPLQIKLLPKPDYGRTAAKVVVNGAAVSINGTQFLYASHLLQTEGGIITCLVPAGEKSWFVLSDKEMPVMAQLLEQAKEATLRKWQEVNSHITYHGPYETEMRNSLRMLRLMTYAENGGIVAAGTTSLPEVPGGSRNYDYRARYCHDC